MAPAHANRRVLFALSGVVGATPSVRATQHIYQDREHPSALILPIIPG